MCYLKVLFRHSERRTWTNDKLYKSALNTTKVIPEAVWSVAAVPDCSLCMFLNSKGMYRKELALTYSRIVLSISPILGHSQRNHSITADQEYYSGSNSLVCRGLKCHALIVYRKVALAWEHYGKPRRCYRSAIRLQLAFLLRLETGAVDGGSTGHYTATSDGLV